MQIGDIGPWFLLVIGVWTFAAGGLRAYKRPEAGRPLGLWLAGLAMSGVGIYGPTFLTSMRDVLEPILGLVGSDSDESRQRFARSVADGELPPELQEVGLAYLLNHPTEDMAELLDESIKGATDERGKDALKRARASLAGRERVAVQLRTQVQAGSLQEQQILKFDPSTRFFLSEELQALPPAELNRVGIRPENLPAIRAPVRSELIRTDVR